MKAAVDVGELCLVEDEISARWYRGRIQNKHKDVCDVYLIDHGNVLSVGGSHLSSCSDDLFTLPPKIVCGFFANVLPLRDQWDPVVEKYFLSLIGKSFTGYIQALLPHKVLILEAPEINMDLIRLGFGKHVDTDTFLLLVEMLTEVPLKQSIEPVPDLLEKTGGQEFSFKPSSKQGFEDILSFCGPKMSAGTQVKVRVTAAVNSGMFYCQMASMTTDLQAVSEKLATACESRSKDPSQKPPENLGLLCSVKGKDEKWHRGLVQFLPVNSRVRVLFIDYGFCESVKVENVLGLPPDLLSTPIMAFPCSLSCVTEQDETVKTEQLNFLKKGLLGGALNVEIKGFDERQNLYSITVLSDSNLREPEPIQEIPKLKFKAVFESEQIFSQGGCLYYETAMIQSLDDSVQAEEVQVDSVFEGYVEHILNPTQFWLRTQKRNRDFEEMMNKMAEHFNQVKLEEDVLENPELGTLCCAMYENDKHYYRAIVIDTLKHGAEVLFIDFGNIEKVPHMLIKKIPEKFASEPAFALNCTLINIIPIVDVWTTANTDFFRRAVSNKRLLVHVVHLRKDRFVVDLHVMGNDDNQSITELLISSNQAEYWKYTPSEPVQYKEKVKKNTNGQGVKYCLTPSKTYSGNTEQWEDCKLNNEKVTKGKTEIPQDMPHYATQEKNEILKPQAPATFKALKFKPGSEIPARCFHVSTPSDFWCQLPSNVPVLDRLMDEIQQYYTTHTVPIQPGVSCCVAKSPEDGRWYRACITGEQKDDIRVILFDYGMTVQTKACNLQTILPQYLELEGQAFRCSLFNLIEPRNGGEWNTEACSSFKDLVQDKTITCSVISQLYVKNKGLFNLVDLHNTQTQQSITKKLVEQGLAREVKTPAKLLSSLRPESFIYSSFNLSIGSEELVYVTHVSTPGEVYCQLDRNSEVIEELGEKVSAVSQKILQANTTATAGKLCLAKFYDGKWYRGVAGPVQSPLHLTVFFVDYGNTYISEKNNIIAIPRDSTDLIYTPMQAVRCSLSQVQKEEIYAEVNQFLEKSILNKPVRAVVVGKSEDGSTVIDLFDGNLHINEKVKELIASLTPKPKEKVVSVGKDSTKTEHKTKIQNHMNRPVMKTPVMNSPVMKTPVKTVKYYHYHHKRPSSKASKSNASTYSDVQNALDKKEANEKSSVLEKSVENGKEKEEIELLDTSMTSQEPPYTTEMPKLSSLPDNKVTAGLRALCYISHVDTVNSFFLQMQEDEPAILKMGEDLNSELFRDSLTKNTSVDLRISDLVLAEYEEDGALYRAVMKGHEAAGCFKVEFVDYGNEAVVGKEKTYFMTGECLSKPRLSIPCSLVDTSLYETDASFTDSVMGKPIMVDFIRKFGARWEVDIEIHDGRTAPSVAPEMTAENGNEKEEEAPALPVSPADKEEIQTPCEQSPFTITQGKSQTIIESESVVFTATGEKAVQKRPTTRSQIRYDKTCRDHHSRKATQTANGSPTVPGPPSMTNSQSSVEVKKDAVDVTPIIRARETEDGTLLSVLHNGDFYVRVNKTTDMFAVLKGLIAKNLHKCEMMAEEDIKEGLKCIIKSHRDNQWHRAVVKHAEHSKYQVFLVDHGVTEEITVGYLRDLCDDLTQIPDLAVMCKWNSLGFPLGEDTHKAWQETLKPMVGKDIKLVFVSYSENDNLWMVEIVMNGLFLMQQIRSATSKQHTEGITPLPTDTQYVTVTEEREPCLDSSPPQQLFLAPVNMNQAYCGFPAAVTTPFEFCVFLEDLLLIMNTVSTILDNLPEEICRLPEAHLIPGSCCLLRSDTKNKWCRAEVIHADRTVVVTNLVDYGHCVDVAYEDRSKLKRLPEELRRLPKVTYPCVLRGVKPVKAEGQWTDEAVVFFQECLYQKNLQIVFRDFVTETHWKVDIVADGVHVAKELVDAGHATYIDIMLGLR